MFNLFPDTSLPLMSWMAAHSPLMILSIVALVAFATMVRFAQRGADSGYDDWFLDQDSSGDSGGGHD